KKSEICVSGLYSWNDGGETKILKSSTFFQACYDSQSSEEELEESTLMKEFIAAVNFTNRDDTQKWDKESALKFQSALAWLGGRGWNTMFTLAAVMTGSGLMTQDYSFWLSYSTQEANKVMNSTLIPLYQSIFGLNESQSDLLANQVLLFSKAIYDITTADSSYLDPTILQGYLNQTSDLSLFGESTILNYSSLFCFFLC
ncbi:hypothetical protein RFI_34763, partial [Reticulomyxa filosa]